MSEEVAVRLRQPGDEEEIVQLLQKGFDGWPCFDLGCTPLEPWRWKYEHNPIKNTIISLGVSQNTIVGVDHSVSIRVKIGEKIYPGHYAADTVVHPGFRGRGISTKVINLMHVERRRIGVQFVYFVTSNPIVVKAWSRTYPSFPKKIVSLIRIRNLDLQLQKMPVKKAWLMKLGFRTVKAFNDFRNLLKKPEPIEGSLHIEDIDFFDERIEEFWGRVSGRYDFMVVRDRDYFNWRYRDPRGGNFIAKQVEEGGRVLGYSVLRINRYHEDYPVGYIVDLLTLPDRMDVANALVTDAVRFFDDENINVALSIVVKDHPYERCFNRWGFIDSRVRLNLLYTVLGMGDEVARLKRVSAGKIHFSYGDIDSLPAEMPRRR